ncbi:hypothetical protein TWF106_002956 [Orbilia oligospora]|uniref:CHAT domain-containing protein n=1 Tax=Orbilia oligospora TaxID=2813651 RepID=A0A7C8QWM6_ORBOL|nr:hypothetical protein TWF106_002956 [Orbilia oligospora]
MRRHCLENIIHLSELEGDWYREGDIVSGPGTSNPKGSSEKRALERRAKAQESHCIEDASTTYIDNAEPDNQQFADVELDRGLRLSGWVKKVETISSHPSSNLEPILLKYGETIKGTSKHSHITTQCENPKAHAPESFQALFMEDSREQYGPDESVPPTPSADLEGIDIHIAEARLYLLFDNGPSIDRAEKLDELGELFLTRWNLVGDIEDIESAIKMEHLAHDSASHSCSGKGKYLLRLQIMLMEKFQATDQLIDIDRAIQVGNELLELSITNKSEDTRFTALHGLATCLQARYEKGRDIEDMNKAINAMEEALALSPTVTERQLCLEGLGRLWLSKYDRTQAMGDLDRAIGWFELSASLGITTEYLKSGYHYLGVCYQLRYCSTGFSGDIHQAAEMAKAVLRLSSVSQDLDSSKLIAYWFNLGSYTYQHFVHTADKSDLQTAIDSFEKALRIPSLSPDQKCTVLCQLGDSLVMRYEDLSKAELVLRAAVEIQDASSINRACAAKSLAYKLAYWGRWEESLAVFQEGVSLLPTFDPKVAEEKLQSNIEAFSGLSRDAAAVALNAGRAPLEALSLLENGRGILSNSHRMKNTTSLMGVSTVSDSIFPYSSDEILGAIGKDRLAVINISKFRCDAILLGDGRIEVVPLIHLDHEVIDEKARLIRSSRVGSWGALEWLWETVALPILKGFEIYQPLPKDQTERFSSRSKGKSQWQREKTLITDDCLPHIWWITTGNLAQIPIHAAGNHFKHSRETVLDCAISSYAVSVKSFIERRREATERGYNNSGKALIVSMPKTPGRSPLHFAEREADVVSKICQSLNLSMETPDLPYGKEEILKRLQDCQIFHFAGHGLSDPSNPSQSHLLLDDWMKSPLTVENLQSLNLHNNPPFLAYLSACSTGLNQVMTLCDENINLISASQLAGIRHVIGTLWEVNDRQCVSVAKTVYETIAKKGLTNHAVALGLHRASVLLRDEVVSKESGFKAYNQSRREKLILSQLNGFRLSSPEDFESCVFKEFPNWLNAELKSYRLVPLRQVDHRIPTKSADTIFTLPVEVAMFRQVPLQPEADNWPRYTNGGRNRLNEREDTSVGGRLEADITWENAHRAALRNPARAKLKKPRIHWAPYVHFGI